MSLIQVPNNILSQFLARPVDRYGIGRNNRNTTLKSTQMGDAAIAQSDGACAIGSGSLALDRSSLAIGLNSISRSANGVAIGEQAQSVGVNTIVIGAKSQAPYPNSIAIGPAVQTTAPNEMRIGASEGTAIKLRLSDMLQFIGNSSSSPGLKANGAVLRVRLADDSNYANLEVLDEAYDATNWNGSLQVPTKNAIRDKIESMGGGGGALAYVAYRPGADGTVGTTTSTVMTAIDGTNVTVTFTAPASGAVSVDVGCLYDNQDAADIVYWGLLDGGGSTVATLFAVANAYTAAYWVSAQFVVTGLTPSTSYTYKLAHKMSGGAGPAHAYGGPLYGQVIMIVRAL